MKAVALANHDVVFLAWKHTKKISKCLGFAIHRIDLSSQAKTTLPSYVGFKYGPNNGGKPKTTEQWPIQKFSWRDLNAESNGFYKYEVVPMIGTEDKLEPEKTLAATTNPVRLTADHGDFNAYFNRGIPSTQFLANHLRKPNGKIDYEKLASSIRIPGDFLREKLSGDMRRAMMKLVYRAKKDGGQCYCALYELSDPELSGILMNNSCVHLILANTGPDDVVNKEARENLHFSGVDIQDRMLKSGHIGHNKFVVYVDANEIPQAVLTGSTNWTPTGLCTQSNNSIIIESTKIASFYLHYWYRLKDEDDKQSLDFRIKNQQSFSTKLDGGKTDVTIWFSPNTQQQTKPKKNPKTPVDLKEVFDVMYGAKHTILFLVFQPGSPSIINIAAECQNKNPDLFVYGAVTDRRAVENFDTQIFHRNGKRPNAHVVASAAIDEGFSYWIKEVYKVGHAIIHDKVVVVDPLSANCAVITGSHNLGFTASYNNDENIVIIRKNRELAKAYAVHIMDVYGQYRWRYNMHKKKKKTWTDLDESDSWQNKYFAKDSLAKKEMEFWCKF